MVTTQEITRVWLNEGVSTGVELPDAPGRFLWNWPVQVAAGDSIEYCQARAIWAGGVEFETDRELPVGSKVRIRRQHHNAEPWVELCIETSTPDKDGTVVVDGTFHV